MMKIVLNAIKDPAIDSVNANINVHYLSLDCMYAYKVTLIYFSFLLFYILNIRVKMKSFIPTRKHNMYSLPLLIGLCP